jgi:hypothetical protein
MMERSFGGPIGNLFAIGVLLFGTNLYREHPVTTGLYVGILALRLVVRVVLTLVWRRTHSGPVQFPIWLIGISAYALSAPTGLYTAFIMRQYGYGDWNSLVVYIFAMACAISGMTAIAPDLRIATGYQVLLSLPVVLVSLFTGGRHAYVVGAFTLLFAIYAVIQSMLRNIEYWNSVAADLAHQGLAEESQAAIIAADAASRAKSHFPAA